MWTLEEINNTLTKNLKTDEVVNFVVFILVTSHHPATDGGHFENIVPEVVMN